MSRPSVPIRRRAIRALSVALLPVALSAGGCATESSRPLEVPRTAAATTDFAGTKVPVSIGKFDNRSDYMRGVFTDGVDRLGSTARTVLASHLQQSRRFDVLDRDNLAQTKQEAQFQSKQQAIRGGDYVVTGDISAFGRREVGDRQLFGLLGRGKTQVAYAKVTLNIVDTLSSAIVFSAGGAGEYELSNREVVGFGGTAGYDATLNAKVLDLAMREAVDKLVAGLAAGQWGRRDAASPR